MFLPETKGVPLEEMAKRFGDIDQVQVFMEDIHVDHNTHELVVFPHGTGGSDAEVVAAKTVKTSEEERVEFS
jgi:triacylglycerol esterase/lipase EstA (alpha/beta hydrolase family)